MLFVTNKISNHIDSMQEVNKVNNILVKHYPNEATVYYSNRATTDMDSNLFKNNYNPLDSSKIHGGISISPIMCGREMLPK